ncbi:helix-turn-helix domain-containing protein [Chitinophaga filiformis]|uniref:AraC family transcriptional regulator n=1 Tax=Chitinophaga filiformis TaxID=104663 RepID=A0ABY4I0E2_CHIFI|nr:AraC family transcriptional regulator [Chitinophaga filiformis]UPK69120.1 AraC family transcriptional regulator [Chitinophaga filiformis]
MAIPDSYSFPYFLLADNDRQDDIHILSFQTGETRSRSKIMLGHNLFSFLMEGEKRVYYAEKHAVIDNSQFLLLSAGNCIMSEKQISDGGLYKSVMLSFEQNVLTGFFLKYPHVCPDRTESSSAGEPFIVFNKDGFLRNFIDSLWLILEGGKPLSMDMKRLKFEELLLYIAEHYPQQLLSLRAAVHESEEDMVIRKSAETNLYNNVTVEELAFLCNMSLSTYKRKFNKVYGMTPAKWFLQKRMEMAATMLLARGEKPSEVYHKIGYENHSSFTQSFKQIYGLTPSEYQQQKLTVQP